MQDGRAGVLLKSVNLGNQMTIFDPVKAMSSNIAANATKRQPLPPGEVIAQVMDIKFSEGISGQAAKKPGQPWHWMDVQLQIKDPTYLKEVDAANPPEQVTTFLGLMLDIQDGEISTGPNSNIRLGRFREACGVNGQPLGNLKGCYVRIQIGNKPHPTDPQGGVLDEIVAYTKP